MPKEVEVVRTTQPARRHRAQMMALDRKIRNELPPVELEYEHFFAHGTYTRVMHVPAGTVLTGRIHKHSCINILVKGHMQVATPDGPMEVKAPAYFVSEPGVQKAGYAFEDSIWINVVPNEEGETDLEALEDKTTYASYAELEYDQQLKLEDK